MDAGPGLAAAAAHRPWRASAVPSQSSSISLDQLCVRRNSLEVSGRFLASQEFSSPFITPVSSVHHLDEIIDDLNDEFIASASQASGQQAQAGSSCGMDALHPLPLPSRVYGSGAAVLSGSGHAAPYGRSQGTAPGRTTRPDFGLLDSTGCLVRPIQSSSALQAFLCDESPSTPPLPLTQQQQPQHRRSQAPCHGPAPPAGAPCLVRTGAPLQGPPHHMLDAPLAQSLACAAPGANARGAAASAAAIVACNASTRTDDLQLRASAPPAFRAPYADAAVPTASSSSRMPADYPTALRPRPEGNLAGPCCASTASPSTSIFGQPLPGGMMSSLRKAASDVVSHLRALGSGRNSRAGTGAATPTAPDSQRQSTDSNTIDGGGGAAAGFCNSPFVASFSTRPASQQPPGGGAVCGTPGRRLLAPSPLCAATQLRKEPSSGVASDRAAGAACLGGAALDCSLGDSASAVPSSWVAGAISSSLLWANGGRDSCTSGSVLTGRGGFLDERQGFEVLTDMWDLARVLDEVDDGFPDPVRAPGACQGGSVGELTVADLAGPNNPQLKVRTAPMEVLLTGEDDSGPQPGCTPRSMRALVRSAGTPREGIGAVNVGCATPGAVAGAAARVAAAVCIGGERRMRGHDAEQMYVLSELVHQARASEGSARSRHGHLRGSARTGAATARWQPPQELPRPQRRGEALFQGYSTVPTRQHLDDSAPPLVEGGGGGGDGGGELPFSGSASTGRLRVAHADSASAPSRLASTSGGSSVPSLLWSSFQSTMSPTKYFSPSTLSSATAITAPAAAVPPATAAVPPAAAAAVAAAHVGSAYGRQMLVSGSMYGVSSSALGSGSSNGGVLETGPELSMFWPLVMPTPVSAVMAGDADDDTGTSCPFLLNVLVACGCGSAHGCIAPGAATATAAFAAAAISPRSNVRANSDPQTESYWTDTQPASLSALSTGSALGAQAAPPLRARTSVSAMLSGVQLAQVLMNEGGCEAAMLRLPLLPAMQLVNVFATSSGDVGPAASLLAVPPAMAAELHAMFVEKVELSLASIMEPEGGSAGGGGAMGSCRRRSGSVSNAARSAALQAQVRKELAALREASPAAAPWTMSVPVWSACRTEWRTSMQPLLHDICYLLLCVPNCFAHGLVEWDRAMYCETLARLLAQLERHELWQTISVLLEYCTGQGVALLYQGEAVGAGSLSAERVREMLEGALYDEIAIKAIGGGVGAGGSGAWSALAAPSAAAGASALAGGNGGSRGRRASVTTLMSPDGADAATAFTLQAWRRRSVDAPCLHSDPAAAGAAAAATAAGLVRGANGLAGLHDLTAPHRTAPHRTAPPSAATGCASEQPLRSQASIGRVLTRVLAMMARGAEPSTPGGTGGVPKAEQRDVTARVAGGSRNAGAGAAEAVGEAAAATAGPVAGAPGQRLGHVIENTAVVLAFAGVMLQSLL